MKALLTLVLTGLISLFPLLSYAENLTITAINDTVFLHQSSRQVEGYGAVTGNGLIVVNGAEAYLVDTPWDRDDIGVIQKWLEQRSLSLAGVIATHSHDDAGGNLDVFNQQHIPTWAHALTNEFLQEKGEQPATHMFTDSDTVLTDTIEVFYPGPGHTLDNIVVWLPKQQVLFGGCFIRAMETNSMGYTAEGDVEQWGASAQRVLDRYRDIDTVVPGHGETGSVDMIKKTQRMAQQAAAAVLNQ